MVNEESLRAALQGLHGRELEVWLRLQEVAENIGNQRWKASKRYRELAQQCSLDPAKPLSVESIQLAVRSLRKKGWLLPTSHAYRSTPIQFILSIPEPYQVSGGPNEPPAYESFTLENRDLFLLMKQSLRPEELADIEEDARSWLQQRGKYNAVTHRDKVDELIMRQKLGPMRAAECEHAFVYLYKND